jgi:hypothetical protein
MASVNPIWIIHSFEHHDDYGNVFRFDGEVSFDYDLDYDEARGMYKRVVEIKDLRLETVRKHSESGDTLWAGDTHSLMGQKYLSIAKRWFDDSDPKLIEKCCDAVNEKMGRFKQSA